MQGFMNLVTHQSIKMIRSFWCMSLQCLLTINVICFCDLGPHRKVMIIWEKRKEKGRKIMPTIVANKALLIAQNNNIFSSMGFFIAIRTLPLGSHFPLELFTCLSCHSLSLTIFYMLINVVIKGKKIF